MGCIILLARIIISFINNLLIVSKSNLSLFINNIITIKDHC